LPRVERADLRACERAESFLQSALWGAFKARFGWEARAFVVEWAPGETRPLLALCRKIAPGLRMAYVPLGPEIPESPHRDDAARGHALALLAKELRPHLPRSTAFIRFDPPWTVGRDERPEILEPPFRRAGADIQPPDTVVVDIARDEEAILAGMKPKWRYNIGLAQRRGVEARASSPGDPALESDLAAFYGLLLETAERDGIAIHGERYYKALFEECALCADTDISLYTAWHEGDCLAGLVALRRKLQAVYLYGASSGVKRGLMAPYALQWQAMRDAKAAGCAGYDFFGIPPDDDPAHPMSGLYRFKTGFGGEILRQPGSWDYPYRPAICALFRAAELARKKLRDARKKRKK